MGSLETSEYILGKNWRDLIPVIKVHSLHTFCRYLAQLIGPFFFKFSGQGIIPRLIFLWTTGTGYTLNSSDRVKSAEFFLRILNSFFETVKIVAFPRFRTWIHLAIKLQIQPNPYPQHCLFSWFPLFVIKILSCLVTTCLSCFLCFSIVICLKCAHTCVVFSHSPDSGESNWNLEQFFFPFIYRYCIWFYFTWSSPFFCLGKIFIYPLIVSRLTSRRGSWFLAIGCCLPHFW